MPGGAAVGHCSRKCETNHSLHEINQIDPHRADPKGKTIMLLSLLINTFGASAALAAKAFLATLGFFI